MEMHSLQAAAKDLEALGVQVMAVSLDDVATQKSFCVEQGYNFNLLSDPDGSVAAKYGSLMKDRPFAQRDTIIIRPQGTVAHLWRGVQDLQNHGQQLVELVRKLQAEPQ